ncbi:glycolate oxidase iron-sulfur subunit [Geothermobacter ehrlichii]|uniref:Glycolate oxidase iron-sulfur subunit n=1 Tax=Geothermobacter ehrlichii TaxID=213224 RepID=A0A5D3WJA7_9BACT|nr:(Fe-S)-binding protein [Geothermobacter ehrlichii]TYO96663.1 glycolate oxidase iron-sulfur subunit [Geothermobacter ehrlichii]
MAKLKNLEDYRDAIEQCVKCGACRAHCPVFGAERREGRVARGKVALSKAVLDGEIGLEAKVLEDLSQCLLCGSCCAGCPNKVPTEEIVAAARRRIAEQQGLSTFGKGVAAVLGRPKLMNALAKTGGALSSLLFRKLPENSGLRLRFPLPYLESGRTLPPLSARPFRERHPERIAGEASQPTVAFFTGCGINYMYPEIGEAFLKALRFLGVTVIIPADQACCGLPAVSAGAGEVVEKLAEQNLAALSREPVDFVLTACASCNAGLGKIYAEMGEPFEKLAEKTRDIFVFLVEMGLPEKLAELPSRGVKTRVTYHDPCHLRTRGITAEPRAILRALPQVEFVEMENAGTCCGLGGTYSVYHYENSRKIGAKKAGHIEESGAELVATDCPGCIMQLQDAINHAGGRQRAVHILELLREALPEEK